MADPPPLRPEEKVHPAEFGRLALKLLRELAKQNPELARRVRERGIEPRR
jgi:hypothetical protein